MPPMQVCRDFQESCLKNLSFVDESRNAFGTRSYLIRSNGKLSPSVREGELTPCPYIDNGFRCNGSNYELFETEKPGP